MYENVEFNSICGFEQQIVRNNAFTKACGKAIDMSCEKCVFSVFCHVSFDL